MYSKELTEKKNDLITRAEAVLDKAKTENRELSEEEAAEIKEIRDNVRRIAETLNLGEDVKKMGAEEAPKSETDADVEETRAFEAYVRGVVNERASNLTLTDNGAVIPASIANKIIKKVYDLSPVLRLSTKYNVKGTIEIPYYDEETSSISVAYATEFTELNSNVGKFKNITLTGFLAGALSLISRSLINNSQFDIVSFVVDAMAESIARFIEHECLVGTPDKATGLSTLTNSLTSAAATAITADELITLQGKIKDIYQANAVWVMSPNTKTALRRLKDGENRYLLQDDISAPFGHTLLGKPIYVTDNMPDMAAGKTAIYYGDFKGLSTKFTEDINIQVLRERYADQHAVGVIGWLEFDSKVENAQKLTKLVMKA